MRIYFSIVFFLCSISALAQNPVFPGFYADPEGVVLGKSYWIFPTYSAPYEKQVFLDAFSSSDLVHWQKHPKVLDTAAVKWAKRAMWAPAIVEKENRYYLFFSANDIQTNNEYGGIGVAVADKPAGPFRDHIGKPLINAFHNGAQPIDQFVFKDKDGQFYMFYGGWRHCNVVKLNKDFTGLVPFPDGSTYKEVTPEGYVEGPFMFMRNGKYYFMWSEGGWTGPDYSVAYAVSDSPFGPFTRIGKILQQDPAIATGAGHHSVVNVPGTDDWYIVYHRRPLNETDRNARVTCIERMDFDGEGKILPVKITHEGVRPRYMGRKSQAVILDTDIGPDYDDVGALAMLHAMADSGYATILATIASNKYPNAAAVLDVFNTYFGRPDVPIGVIRGNAPDIGVWQKWDSVVLAKYPHDVVDNAQAEDATRLYRKILAAQPDTSVTIITIGFLGNLSNLLRSAGDEYSALDGSALVKQKVRKLVSMAGRFDGEMGAFKEFNVVKDSLASVHVFANWPTVMEFSGFEIGVKILSGLPLIQADQIAGPVKDVFKRSIPLDKQDANGRMSWDQTAVLAGVLGAEHFFVLVPGTIIGKNDGSIGWRNGNGKHRYYQFKMPVAELTNQINTWMMHQPNGER